MTDRRDAESALSGLGDASDSDVVETFGLLANETRLAILLALWEGTVREGDPSMSFSELRERVGVQDSGQFNYHLGKLDGPFIRGTDRGYELTRVGRKLVQTVIADADREASLPPTDIDVDCNLCGAPTALTYRDGWLFHLCTECEGGFGAASDLFPRGILFGEPFPPAALAGRTAEEVFAAGVFRLVQSMVTKIGGLCPTCSGVIDSSLRVCMDHDGLPGDPCSACGNSSRLRVEWLCSTCKYAGSSSPRTVACLHPAVLAFAYEHGVEVGYTMTDFERCKEVLEYLHGGDQELVSTDPVCVRVTVQAGGAELTVTLDEDLELLDISAD